MTNSNQELLPRSTKAETALEVAATIGSIIPWAGGPISNVLSGMSQSRKLGRISEVLRSVADELAEFKSGASERYVQTEDFEDILEHVLKRVAEERNEEKRAIYGQFILGAIQSPGEPYDEQLRSLRTLEEMQHDHLVVLLAFAHEPGNVSYAITGSPGQTLGRRLPGMASEKVDDLVSQLNDMRIVKLANSTMNTNMTPEGAADLRSCITDYGRRFLQYLVKAGA